MPFTHVLHDLVHYKNTCDWYLLAEQMQMETRTQLLPYISACTYVLSLPLCLTHSHYPSPSLLPSGAALFLRSGLFALLGPPGGVIATAAPIIPVTIC